jgi:hypothetical protein
LSGVKAELAKLVCGDPQYNDVRAQIADLWNNHKAAVVSAITVAIAGIVGVAAAALMPVIALLLALVSKVGSAAWCSINFNNNKLAPE